MEGNETTQKGAEEYLQVGKTYRHKTVGTVMEIRGVSPVVYYDRVHGMYDCFLIHELKMMQLPVGKESEWEEVVVDDDGLVYELTPSNDKEC